MIDILKMHRRKSIRCKEYDYSQPGEYFVTVCALDHECVFGKIDRGEMYLNNIGKIAEECWKGIMQHFNNIELDSFIIMPNHLHGIITICECNNHCRGEVTSPLHKPTLGKIVAYFKYQSTKMINEIRRTPGKKRWQRNYYDRIIRYEKELNNIRNYIRDNAQTWAFDKDNSEEVPLFLKNDK